MRKNSKNSKIGKGERKRGGGGGYEYFDQNTLQSQVEYLKGGKRQKKSGGWETLKSITTKTSESIPSRPDSQDR